MPSFRWTRRNYLKTMIAAIGATTFMSQSTTRRAIAPFEPDVLAQEAIGGTGLQHNVHEGAMVSQNFPDTATSTLSELNAPNAANVMAYGATGDGVTDDSAAIAAAITAAGQGGTVLFPPGRMFFIANGLHVNEDSLSMLGYGAILKSSTLDGTVLTVTGDEVTIEGLRFEGPGLDTNTIPATFLRSRAIEILGGQNTHVTNCRFKGYSAGGIRVRSDYCRIAGNHFQGVRHFASDYLGVIYITGSDNIITGNIVEEVWDTGIHVRGGARNSVTGNTVVCSTHANATKSMGLRVNAGGQYNVFSANVVRNARKESITLAAPRGLATTGNVISSNILIDGFFAGIVLAAMSGGTIDRNVIANNTINARNNSWSHGILITTGAGTWARHNLVQGNMISGADVEGVLLLQNGIRQDGPGTDYNQIMDNRIINVANIGISCLGKETLVSGNYLDRCNTGISAAYCEGSLVTSNIVRASATDSIRISTNVDRLVVAGNTLDRECSLNSPRGTYVIERNYIAGAAVG
jgi:parallel beta-helix repeat protein